MTRDELKVFSMEMKIDANINKVKRIVNQAYNYLENDFALIEKKEILEELEDAEYALKKTSDLIDKLAEIMYEKQNSKNS